jgi:hypothetical protein
VTLRDGMHIRVTEHGSNSAFNGRAGIVVRLCRGGGAWVNADEPLPANLCSFPAGDGRRDQFRIYDDECVEILGV